jgi:hypothetical protein
MKIHAPFKQVTTKWSGNRLLAEEDVKRRLQLDQNSGQGGYMVVSATESTGRGVIVGGTLGPGLEATLFLEPSFGNGWSY